MAALPDVVKALFAPCQIDELRQHIAHSRAKHESVMRKALVRELDALAEYRNAPEWNRLVRVCEALTILGWGELEPLEATAHKWINGQFFTRLGNRYFEMRYREAGWLRQGKTFVLEPRSCVFHAAPARAKSLAARHPFDRHDYGVAALGDQRVAIAKSPVQLQLAAGTQKFRAHVDAWHRLRQRFLRELEPALYGSTVGCISVQCLVSDDVTQYFSRKELPENVAGHPVVKDRVECDRLSTLRGNVRASGTRYLPAAFAKLEPREQREETRDELLALLALVFERLEARRIRYDTARLRGDVLAILDDWVASDAAPS